MLDPHVSTSEKTRKEARNWLNATPVDSNRQPLDREYDDIDWGVLTDEIDAIRTALASGVDNVDCFVTRPDMICAIRECLTAKELAHVTFPTLV